MRPVLARLVALCLLSGARSAQVLGSSEDGVFVLNFRAEPHERIALDNFVRMLEEVRRRAGDRARSHQWEYHVARHGTAACAGNAGLAPQANGNVLVGLADEAFEVTRAGALVWRHRNPPPGKPGRLGARWVPLSTEASAALLPPPPR